ncbi:MAG TPA: hypothetical protein VIJ68_01160 [Candidatus Saccharimonadales bacterium]
MALHNAYPETVRTALASDQYWVTAHHAPNLLLQNDSQGTAYSLRDGYNINRNTEMADQIGSIVSSLVGGGTYTPLSWGEEIPIPHGRQVVRVIEDSRRISSLLSPLEHAIRFIDAYDKARVEKLGRKKLGPDFHLPTFEESLLEIHAGSFAPPDARTEVPYGRTRIAHLTRGVRYLRFDEASGQFAALPSRIYDVRGDHSRRRLKLIPRVRVGEIYNKDIAGNELGRIVSAGLLEAHTVTWRDSGKTSGPKRPKKRVNDLLPKPAATSIS